MVHGALNAVLDMRAHNMCKNAVGYPNNDGHEQII